MSKENENLIVGFLKVRNEIIREGNIYRCLQNMQEICDEIYAIDDASYDGKDIMHHSAEEAHDTTHDHYYPYDIYGNKHEHDFAPPPAKKPDHDKPMQEMYNPEDDKHGRVWKPTHDTSMNGNMKHEDAK